MKNLKAGSMLVTQLLKLGQRGIFTVVDPQGRLREYDPDRGAAGKNIIAVELPEDFPAEPDVPFMILPVTAAQLALYYESQLHPDSTAYQINAPFHFLTPPSLEDVIDTFEAVLNRYLVLRTTFKRLGDQFVQWIRWTDTAEVNLRDLDDCSQATIEAAMQQDCAATVDITVKNHILHVYRYDNKVLACMPSFYHAMGDLASAALLAADIGNLLGKVDTGPVDDPYVQFVQKQLENETGGLAERNRSFWLKKFTPLPTPTELPGDYPRPTVQSHDSADFSFKIDKDLRKQIKRLAGEYKTDELSILLAVYQVFLAFFSGSKTSSVSLVYPTSARRKFPDLYCYGVQEVPLIREIDFQTDLHTLVEENKIHQYQLFKHRDINLLDLSAELGLPHDTGRAAIAHYSFVAYPEKGPNDFMRHFSLLTMGYLSGEMVFSDFRMNFLPAKVAHWPNELSLISGFHPDGFIPLVFRYHTALFSRKTIWRYSEYFVHICKELVENPEKAIADLNLVIPEERRQLSSWGANPHPYDQGRLVPDLFEARSAASPDADALVFSGKKIIYRALNQLANAISHTLRARPQIKTASKVGLLFRPSVEMIAAILGVLKAGCAFVPIDPNLPKSRVHQIVEQGNLALILSHGELAGRFQDRIESIDVVPILGSPDVPARSNPVRDLPPEALAYIFFTSGSTGTPKGVMLQHDAFLASQLNWIHSPGVAQGDRVLSVYNYAFDASLITNVAPLLAGACVVLANTQERQDPRLLAELMEREAVNSMCATTSHYRLLILGGWQGRPELKAVSGGEAFADDTAEFLLATCREVWNAYGPTEASNIVSTHRLENASLPVPIGVPAENARLYILNEAGMQVPPGIRGELYAGGAFVARGYINRPELTAAQFLPDPFSEQPGARMYRTGDTVSYREDGMILYHGRKDLQVKIRGYRVELGEIEQVINRFAGISASVVQPYPHPGNSTGLAGYVVVEDGSDLHTEQLHAHLKEQLPEYMVPDVFIPIEEIPLNGNGKKNASALPAPGTFFGKTGESRKPGTGAEPLSDEEQRVADIWAIHLNRAPQDPEDNFFEIGGSSLSLLHVVKEFEAETGRRLPLVPFVRYPTLRQMANTLQEIGAGLSGEHSTLIPVQTGGAATPIFCVTAGYGDLIAYQQWAGKLRPDQPFYVLQPTARFSSNSGVQEIAMRYIHRMQTVQEKGPYYVMGHSLGGIFAYEIARQLLDKGERLKKLLLVETLPEYPAEFNILMDWMAKTIGKKSPGASSNNILEAMLRDEGWKILFGAVRRYQARPLPGDMTLVTTPLARPFLKIRTWKRLVQGRLDIKLTTGNHYSMLREEAPALIELLAGGTRESPGAG